MTPRHPLEGVDGPNAARGLRVRWRPSPNFGARRGEGGAPPRVDMLVLHATEMPSAAAALARLRDPAARVSAHYLIRRDGAVFQMVAESRRAWHAGVSRWRGSRDVNSRSIGIELDNAGSDGGHPPFPAAQMRALLRLCRVVMARWRMPPGALVAHADVAPTRRRDPGPRFDWAWLAARGVGLWPDAARAWPMDGAVSRAAGMLRAIGYDMSDPAAAIAAFQRRFRPRRITGRLDRGTAAAAARLARLAWPKAKGWGRGPMGDRDA